MILWHWLYWDFKDQAWPERIAGILLGVYFLTLLIAGGILVYWLLTLTPLL